MPGRSDEGNKTENDTRHHHVSVRRDLNKLASINLGAGYIMKI